MYVEKYCNNGLDYLRVVEGYRVKDKNGHSSPRKHLIKNLGPLAQYDDGEPDYVNRLKASFKTGNPLIEALKPYCGEAPAPQVWRFAITEGSPDCFGVSKLCANILLEQILEAIDMRQLFSSYKGFKKFKYDVYGFFKLLVFGRILNPASKCATVEQNDNYIEPILDEGYNSDNVYDTLDFIHKHKFQITKRINTKLVQNVKRSPGTIYYDVTNFFFEIDDPDDDELDDEGNVVKDGLRELGVCKEERKLPIVQMGLFMDDNGLPISIEQFPGNTLDHQTFKPALKAVNEMDFQRYIMIADRGMYQGPNLFAVVDAGNGYIVSRSLLKSTKQEREWAYSDEDYIKESDDFKYKSRIVKKQMKDADGNLRTLEQKVVVYWSARFQARAEKENKSFLDFLKKLEESPNSFRITALQSKKLKQFMKDMTNLKTGEVIESKDVKPNIDFDKVAAYKESLGYYQIVTSELNMNDLEVIDKYHGLTQIENQFRVMKGVLDTRPIFVWTDDHIEAHLMVCFVSLVVIRIIQKRLTDSGVVTVDHELNWGYGMSAERIQKALNSWKVELLPDGHYRFEGMNNSDLQLILKAFNVELPAKLYTINEIKGFKKQMTVFK